MTDGPAGNRQKASLRVNAGAATLEAQVEVTPAGLLSIGALVSGILISTSLLVWAATNVARRHPLISSVRAR